MMEDKKILLDNIDRIHTTKMGVDRIKRNLKIDEANVVVISNFACTTFGNVECTEIGNMSCT